MTGIACRLIALVCFALVLFPEGGRAQFTRDHDVASLRSFHGDVTRIRRSFESDDEARNVFRQVLAAGGFAGIEDRITLRASAEAGGAEAVMERRNGQDERYIFYNAVFMREIAARTSNYWSLVAILAHEIGHHVRFHTTMVGRLHEFELEADYQAGFILRRLGATIDETQAVYRILPEAESKSHPGRAQRLQSVTLGWNQGGSGPFQIPPSARPMPAPGEPTKRDCSASQVRRADGTCVARDPTKPFARSFGAGPLSRSDEAAIGPLQTFKECEGCPVLVALSPGVIEAGAAGKQIRISRRFAVSKYEITFAEWDACNREGGCAYVPDDSGWGRGDRPVTKVSWNDVITQYLPWLSRKTGGRYRLPTEAEWLYAAAAGSTSSFAWGDDFLRGQANCAACGSPWDNKQSAPVGSFSPNAFGLFDVHGNVWEWVEDCVAPNYPPLPSDGRAATGEEACFRGLRGGSWDTDAGVLQFSSRGRNRSNLRSHSVGFRVIRQLQ